MKTVSKVCFALFLRALLKSHDKPEQRSSAVCKGRYVVVLFVKGSLYGAVPAVSVQGK